MRLTPVVRGRVEISTPAPRSETLLAKWSEDGRRTTKGFFYFHGADLSRSSDPLPLRIPQSPQYDDYHLTQHDADRFIIFVDSGFSPLAVIYIYSTVDYSILARINVLDEYQNMLYGLATLGCDNNAPPGVHAASLSYANRGSVRLTSVRNDTANPDADALIVTQRGGFTVENEAVSYRTWASERQRYLAVVATSGVETMPTVKILDCARQPTVIVGEFGPSTHGQPTASDSDEEAARLYLWTVAGICRLSCGAIQVAYSHQRRLFLARVQVTRCSLAHGMATGFMPAEIRILVRTLSWLRWRGAHVVDAARDAGDGARLSEHSIGVRGLWAGLPLELFEAVVTALWDCMIGDYTLEE